MSAICHGFVQNAWRKDICSNCFRLRDEHSVKSDLNHRSTPQYNQSQQQQHLEHSENNNNNNSKMNAQNHSISILVKNGDNNSYKNPSPRYQSPTSGIPRASSHLKYQHSLSGKSYFNGSTFSVDSIRAKAAAAAANGLNKTNTNSSEVIDISGNKKSVTHPLRGDKSENHHLQIASNGNNNNRLTNNILNGSSAPPALNLVASSSSTVVSVNGKSERSGSTAHFNNNHSSTNANNSSQGSSSSNRRNNSVSSGPAGGASSCSGSTSSVGAPCANGTVVSVLTNGHTKTLQYPKAVGFASDVNSKKFSVGGVSACESSSGMKVAQKSAIMDTTDGDITNLHKSRTKGILKAVNGKNPKRLSVKFPKEVVEFIGYGDDLDASEEEEEEDDDDELSDPQDNASISELLANNSTSPEEKELHQQTIKNTNFNSIKSNLMGFAPIEIGPIVGCTGGKSMENSSKPLVSIETFESRKEPLRITRKSDANGIVDVVPVDSSKKQQATVPSKITSEKTAAIGALFKNSTTTATEVKTSGNKQQQPRSANNANDEYAVVNKKSSMKVGATNGRQQHDVKFNVTSGNDGVSTIEVNPEKFPITLTTEIPCKTSEELRNEGERSKPKSILKTTTTTASTTTSFPNKNSNDDDSTIDSTLINSTARSSGEKSLSNLIILNSGSIASKRTSFLQEIISAEPVTVLTGQTTTESYSSEEPVSLSMERDSLEASMHHLKLGPFKSFEIEDNSSEFDDSLEDSGLDIGKTKAAENSESDDNDNEKFIGSNSSDSGNENDFTERGDTIPKGLYISVDDEVVGKAEDEDVLATQPKLSPDSVLFSSASETSNTGSAESIPECLNVQVIASVVKRQAPAPPPSLPAHQAESLYANENGAVDDEEQQVDQCDVYDDVSCYQKPIMTEKGSSVAAAVPTVSPQQQEVEEEEEEEEESIYDDCNAISTNTSNGKFMTGSYDFTNGTRTKLDTDSGPDLSDRIPRHVDGIEFIGIRKIDSETHLNNAGLSNGSSKNKQQRSPSPEDVKRERSSSVSPKARRKVNHFFSTIGKRAGAAFGSSHSPLSGAANFMRQKSPSPGPVAIAHEYKRSLSQDEVSMSRTQEIYATLTPASLKFKGLAPVLQKLSRMDTIDGKEDSPKEKMFKKHKLLPSIKKLLRMGSKDVSYSGTDDVRSYDFKTDLRATNSGGDSSPGASSESTTPNPPSSLEDDNRSRNTNPSPVSMSTPPPLPPSSVLPNQVPPPKPAPPSSRPPPPPPPRVHSLDLMHRVGQQVAMHGPNGTIKPARPPPPVRSNRVAPSFVSMFAAPVSNEDEQQQQQQLPREVPPSKPRRKASMNTHSTSLVMRSDGEPSLENHVSNLNIETLKLIAGQAPEKIRQNSSQLIRKSSGTPIRWSQFYITDVEPMASGDGFAFYCGRWDDEPCVLLLEEESNNSVVIHLSSCVEICTSFVDIVPAEYVPWNVADYSNGGLDVRASISVLPPCMVTKISSYISSRTYPSMQKYYALLQALSYWGKADMSDLFVLEGETQPSGQTAPAESELVYVCPIPSSRSFTARCSSQSTDFEILLKQYLLQPCVTSHGDQQVLLRIISGSPSEVEAQVKLFLQVKLFGDRMKPEELEKLRKTRTDRAILQWLERERALCMKEAIERTLFRESAPISPMRKSFVEFLMIPDTSAKALLELVLDLSK